MDIWEAYKNREKLECEHCHCRGYHAMGCPVAAGWIESNYDKGYKAGYDAGYLAAKKETDRGKE